MTVAVASLTTSTAIAGKPLVQNFNVLLFMLSFELDVEDASYLRHLIIKLFGLHEGCVWL
jgi:hypothetical protein